MIKDAIQKVVDGKDLLEVEASEAMIEIMSGEGTPAQIAALLTALRIKGESVEEITGFARVMREKATKVPHSQDAVAGHLRHGRGPSNTFNISTTAAFVAAGLGVRIAKHGNRALTSLTGSSEVLAALGVKIDLTPERVGACIDSVGIGFLFAPALHSAMKHAGPVRKEIGIRTAFNLLGPLTNPAGARHQVVGVPDADYVEKLAQVLGNLGSKHAFVVHGDDGLDEITTTGETRVAEWKGGKVRSFYLDPEEYGIRLAKPEDLKGGDAALNAEITRAVLKGSQGPKRDIVLLNAAAALVAADKAATLKDGVADGGPVHRQRKGPEKVGRTQAPQPFQTRKRGTVENILKKIIANKKKEVEAAKKELPMDKILARLVTAPPSRNFKNALKLKDGLALIAEIKRASPSKGALMGPKQSVTKLAQTYAANGATAISVVTESKFFKGDLGMIEEVKKACGLPILRKDFIVDIWQLRETRIAKADGVLLIASLFNQPRDLRKMIQGAMNLSLLPLVEVHTADDLKKALRAEAEFIGINNRNLATFKVDLKITEKLLKKVPEDKFFISESGIHDPRGRQRSVEGRGQGHPGGRIPDQGQGHRGPARWRPRDQLGRKDPLNPSRLAERYECR